MRRLVYILLLAALSVAAAAQAPADRRDVRRGNRDFRKQNFKEAEIDYRKAILRDSTSVKANYNLANTLYRLEDYQEAEKYIDKAEPAAGNAGPSAEVYFNKGDIALKNQNYNAAVEAFKQALLLNPGDVDAKENYIYARKMLEDQQQNQQNQNNDQNNDQDQDQNQDQNQNQDQDNNDRDKDDNQDRNNDQNQDQDQNQNQDQNNDQNQDQQQNQQPQLSPQAAQQMLEAIQAKEKETQDKVKKEKALMEKSRQKEKNW